MKNKLLLHVWIVAVLYACSPAKQIGRSAKKNIIDAAALQTAHIGISMYEPATGKYWYNYQADKYFVPASNTKLATCYAAMKYLGDSLVGLRYGIPEERGLKKEVFAIKVTADPTFLHPDFSCQPVFEFLKNKITKENLKAALFIDTTKIANTEGLGSGWAWNDYEESYMAEHNSFPIFGNVINIHLKDTSERVWTNPDYKWEKRYSFFKTDSRFFDSLVNTDLRWIQAEAKNPKPFIYVQRDFSANKFYGRLSESQFRSQIIPFVTNGWQTTIDFLKDSLKGMFESISPLNEKDKYFYDCEGCDFAYFHIREWTPIHTQPTDSLLKIMMHRSDNFFAEQSLLMVSNEMLGVMNDAKIIDTLLKTDFKGLPQKPHWVDGSGLSRYDLFTPQDFIFILNKIKTDFGIERIKNILPTGNTGTLSNYYKAENGFIFAKTGTLSGVVAISGYLYTKKNRLLIFSVLVNNSTSSATTVKRAVEKFIEGVRNDF